MEVRWWWILAGSLLLIAAATAAQVLWRRQSCWQTQSVLSKRSNRFIFFVVLAVLVGCGVQLFLGDPRPELVIAFLERNAPGADPERQPRTELFEALHRLTLEELVKEYNRKSSRFRLRLLKRDFPRIKSDLDRNKTPEKQPDKWQAYLAARYEALAKIRNLAAVFDNAWGRDLLRIRAELRKFPAPIVFLNADHNFRIYPDENPGAHLNERGFGGPRFFVGSSDQVPEEIAAVLPRLLAPSGVIQKSDFVFVTEQHYDLTTVFHSVLRRHFPKGYDTIKLPGDRAKNRLELARARADIITSFLDGGGWNNMSSRPKLLVLNAHDGWGGQLVPWLDDTFTNLTVIAYQSSISRAPGFAFGNATNGNRFVLLSVSPQNINRELFLQYREMKRRFPAEFRRGDAVFFLRRCIVAMDLCAAALASREWTSLEPPARFQSQLAYAWQRFRGESLSGTLGFYRFSNDGELLGQNNFEVFENRALSAFDYQLAYRSGDATSIEAIPASFVTVRNIQVRNLNVATSTMRADFDYRERSPRAGQLELAAESAEAGVLPEKEARPNLRPLDFEPNTLVDPELGAYGQRLMAAQTTETVRDRTFHVSGTFNLGLNPRYYPFDHHRLTIELQAPLPDKQMRLTRAWSEEALKPEEWPKVDGWKVLDSYIALNSRDTNPTRLPTEAALKQQSGYDTILVTIDVRRNLSDAMLLIIIPLALLVIASNAILFIRFGDRSEQLTAGAAGSQASDREALKTQTELSASCLLAVITYLVAYATLAPRLQRLVYSDYLVGFTLFLTVANFFFLVVVYEWKSTAFLRWLTLERYRMGAVIVAAIGFFFWGVWGLMWSATTLQ
jgi:hypothetical protein